jgi:hypothetical protein
MHVFHYKTSSSTAKFNVIRIDTVGFRREFIAGWSKEKGDYWKPEDGSVAKILSAGKNTYEDGTVQYGLYIGRLALVFMKGRVL